MSSKLAAVYGKLPWCIERSSEEYVLCTQLIKGRNLFTEAIRTFPRVMLQVRFEGSLESGEK